MNNSQVDVRDFLDVEDVSEVSIERNLVFESIQHYEHSDAKSWQSVKPTYVVGDVMRDISKKAKRDRNWAFRKSQNSEISEIMLALNVPKNKSDKFSTCAEVLLFAISSDNDMKLKNAWFCKDKLCPICQWRRSLKLAYWNEKIVKEVQTGINIDGDYGKYVFLTLTVKNCSGDDLKDTIKMIHSGFDKMFRRAVFKKYCKGFIRSLEITYNEQTREFHPHLHILMLMDKSYWKYKTVSGKRKLTAKLSHSDFVDYWQRSCNLNYKPSVDIRQVRRKKGKRDSLESAVLEISKYAFKPIDIKNLNDYDKRYVISSLIKGLARVRQVGYGGIFKEVYKKLSVDEEELTRVTNESEDFIANRFSFAAYGYKTKKYYWMHKK